MNGNSRLFLVFLLGLALGYGIAVETGRGRSEAPTPVATPDPVATSGPVATSAPVATPSNAPVASDIRGRVVFPEQEALDSVLVHCLRLSEGGEQPDWNALMASSPQSRATPASPGFEFKDLTPGRYELLAIAKHQSGPIASKKVEVRGTALDLELSIEGPQPFDAIVVRAYDPEGKPCARFTASLKARTAESAGGGGGASGGMGRGQEQGGSGHEQGGTAHGHGGSAHGHGGAAEGLPASRGQLERKDGGLTLLLTRDASEVLRGTVEGRLWLEVESKDLGMAVADVPAGERPEVSIHFERPALLEVEVPGSHSRAGLVVQLRQSGGGAGVSVTLGPDGKAVFPPQQPAKYGLSARLPLGSDPSAAISYELAEIDLVAGPQRRTLQLPGLHPVAVEIEELPEAEEALRIWIKWDSESWKQVYNGPKRKGRYGLGRLPAGAYSLGVSGIPGEMPFTVPTQGDLRFQVERPK